MIIAENNTEVCVVSKKTKIAVLIGAVAAVVSAVILVVVFWDKLLSKCPCKKKATDQWAEDAEAEAEVAAMADALAYNEEEIQDFADLELAAE